MHLIVSYYEICFLYLHRVIVVAQCKIKASNNLIEMKSISYEKMVFTDYVKSIRNEREEFVKTIANITSSSPSSVSRWINGRTTPPIVKQKIIAEHLEIPIDLLFPQKG